MGTVENESKAKRFGKVAIDIFSFAALTAVIVVMISISFAMVLQASGMAGTNSMFHFVLSEILLLIGVLLSAWIVWHLRGFSLAES